MDDRAHWIAWPSASLSAQTPIPDSACWWALEFSPRVVLLEDALLMETSMVQRLWGGIEAMLERLDQSFAQFCAAAPGQASVPQSLRAQGLTAWQALARLRLQKKCITQGQPLASREEIDALPLWTLTALQRHRAVLLRLGCQTWGDVRALPRAGLSRRLGARTLRVLDEAYGILPQALNWLQLPQQFVQRHDLGYPAHHADAVLQAAQPLLRALQSWLQARQHAVLALQLRWHHDLRRTDGQELPPWDALCIRTAQPTQGMDHLQRLLREQLGQRRWRAPVDMLELQALETVPWSAEPQSCLPVPQDQSRSDSLAWHEWVERLSARWGDDAVQMVQSFADHRPDAMQRWRSAAALLQSPKSAGTKNSQTSCADPWQALWPPWLLPQPQALEVQGNRPHWLGPLKLKAGPYRLEAGWWDGESKGQGGAQPGAQPGSQTGLAVRDYFVAYNAVVGHVWIYCERVRVDLPMSMASGSVNWFAQGIYG